MKLAFSVYVDLDEQSFDGSRTTVRDQVTEDIRLHLLAALKDLPLELHGVRVWSRATPNRQQRLTVESIESLSTGRYRVNVRTEDGRTTSRAFETRRAAEQWADRIDPLPLPDSR